MFRTVFRLEKLSTAKVPIRVMPGFNGIDSHAEENHVETLPRKTLQSKPRRQRQRRNVMKRIYGSGYDHGMDDYR
jgi:hypothetical protein